MDNQQHATLLQGKSRRGTYDRNKFLNAAHLQCLAIICAGLFVSALIASLTWYSTCGPNTSNSLQPTRLPEKLYTCGSSAAEARSLGCQFQLFSYTWVPNPCFSPLLDQAFRNSSDRRLHYYLDSGGAKEVGIQEAASGEMDLWATWEEHLMHCAYVFKSLTRAALTGRYTGKVLDVHHTDHCAEKFMSDDARQISPDKINVQVIVEYDYCIVTGQRDSFVPEEGF
ncbi:hypothetical protein DHEL01_v213017 [Diaporthe helianthi]|uniref:Uncharacterized protein n=1 Tax=Diaporthe helianthi TaxID=158607 RepID=A0A2P5HEC7_DIAHE|nr:hypothetical protein DHEL01_v213017 [Diaporthe helianthi]